MGRSIPESHRSPIPDAHGLVDGVGIDELFSVENIPRDDEPRDSIESLSIDEEHDERLQARIALGGVAVSVMALVIRKYLKRN